MWSLVIVLCVCTICLSFLEISSANEVIRRAISEIPHDENCFTQGLVIHENTLYESCGLFGKSSVRIVELATGKVLKNHSFGKEIFAEGLTVWNDTLYMISWKNKKLFVIDRNSLEILDVKHFESFNGEGWGLTTDGKHLILSDGSEHITFYEFPVAKDGKEMLVKVKDMKVFDPLTSRHLVYLNELEYFNGFIFANIWYKDIILQIDAQTGRVVERYDLQHLYPKSKRTSKADVLNGIAFDPVQKNFLLTGKLWPKYFRVNFKELSPEKSAVDL